jgi:hypothetical protein
MNDEKKKKLEEAGWKTGSVEELLKLTEEERQKVDKLVKEENDETDDKD